jgi:hypothetical protein
MTVIALSLPSIASADGVGLMIAGGGTYAQIDDDFDLEDFEDLEAFFDDKSWGLNAGIGWRFNKWLAVDAGYWDLGEFKSDRDGEGRKAKVDFDTLTVGGIVSVPLWILDIYARGGAAMWDADSSGFSEDGTDPYYGIGAALNIGGSLDIYLEIIRFDLETDVDTAGLGVRWTF